MIWAVVWKLSNQLDFAHQTSLYLEEEQQTSRRLGFGLEPQLSSALSSFPRLHPHLEPGNGLRWRATV